MKCSGRVVFVMPLPGGIVGMGLLLPYCPQGCGATGGKGAKPSASSAGRGKPQSSANVAMNPDSQHSGEGKKRSSVEELVLAMETACSLKQWYSPDKLTPGTVEFHTRPSCNERTMMRAVPLSFQQVQPL